MKRTVLITNLLGVGINTGSHTITTHTNALVLLDRGPDDGNGSRYRMYGYHNEAGNPTFDLMLPSFNWTIEPQACRRSFTLLVEGLVGLRFVLASDFSNELPLDIERLEGEEAERGWADLLMRKVLRYYHAPYFIIGRQLQTERARAALGVEGAVEV
jgi:hypothetical protein